MLDNVIASIEAAAKVRKQFADERTLKHSILDDLAPPLWSKIRLALKAECENRPKHFMFRVGANSGATVVCEKTNRALEVNYLSVSNTIAFRILSKDADDFIDTYSIRLDENDLAVIFDPDRRILVSIANVVDKLLTLLLS